MGAWRFAAIGGLCLFASLGACGGDEFEGDSKTGGTGGGIEGGVDGGGTGGTTAGTGGQQTDGSAGQSDGSTSDGDGAPANDCTNELYGQTCGDVSTGNTTCDQCGVTNCCSQVEACLADEDCARAVSCYLKNCKSQSALSCMPANCSACLNSTSIPLFYGASSCLFTMCGAQCPELQQ